MASKNSYSNNGINLDNLSATSSAFMSNIRPNYAHSNMRGGGCPCLNVIKAFKDNNSDLALYVLEKENLCFECQDSKNGDTVLHYLVKCAGDNSKCEKVLKKVVSSIPKSAINMQNDLGQTAMLMAALDGKDEIVDILYNAGADPSIEDKEGNKIGINKESDNANSDSSLELGSDTMGRPSKRQNREIDEDYRSYIHPSILKLVESGKKVLGRTVGDYFNAKPIGYNPTFDSVIEEVDTSEKANSDVKPTMKLDEISTEMDFNTDKKQKTEVSAVDTTTEDMLEELLQKYKIEPVEKEVEVIIKDEPKKKETEIFLNKKTEENLPVSASDEKVDTEKLLAAIKAINAVPKIGSEQEPMSAQQTGGKHKIMGYRNMNVSDSSIMSQSESISYNINTSDSEHVRGISDDGYAFFYNENNEFGGVTSELSRMMQRQRDNLHQQVLDMIMGMLNKGELTQDSVVIKADERNAKLIKAYIYRKVSEKNPQMGGLDKILSISKMSDQQIADMVAEMPDLEELEKNIQKHIEKKRSERESEPKKDKKDKKSKKSKETETSESLDFEMSKSESEKPKKKSTKETKAKKTSKKSKK